MKNKESKIKEDVSKIIIEELKKRNFFFEKNKNIIRVIEKINGNDWKFDFDLTLIVGQIVESAEKTENLEEVIEREVSGRIIIFLAIYNVQKELFQRVNECTITKELIQQKINDEIQKLMKAKKLEEIARIKVEVNYLSTS